MTRPVAIVTIGAGADQIECQVLRASILHGRDDALTQPVASSATLELVGELPAAAVIGARVMVEAEYSATKRRTRFVGEITDRGVSWDDVDIPTPRIIAVGDIGRIGRRVVGDAPFPVELEGERVARILTLAGFPPEPLLSDPGTVHVLARDVDRQPALGLAHATAEDGGGMVWQDREGRVRYADAQHRRGIVDTLEVQACDIGIGLEWSETLEGLVNDVTIRYGPTPEGGEQPEVRASDPDSIAERGTFAVSTTTAIANVEDANERAGLIIARYARPAWSLGGLELDMDLLDLVQTEDVLTLDVHSLLSVTGLPESSPQTSAVLWVEGWAEIIDPGGWVIAFNTSDYCRTAAAPFWDDLPPAVTWDSIDPVLSWDDARCMPPEPPRGRWNDVPSSVRWDTVDPTTTWDNWQY